MKKRMRYIWMVVVVAEVLSCGRPVEEREEFCKGRVAGDLVITEYMNNPKGVDKGKEWIELYNATSSAINLEGIEVYVLKKNGAGIRVHVIKGKELASGEYWVMGAYGENEKPEWIAYSYGQDLGNLPASEGVLGVRCGDLIVDEIRILTFEEEAGHAVSLDGKLVPDAISNDDSKNWCYSSFELGEEQHGTPGKKNTECVDSNSCRDPGTQVFRAVRSPRAGKLAISEVMANPVGADKDKEWFEVFALDGFDLNEVEVWCGKNKTVYSSDECLSVEKGKYMVFARSRDMGNNEGVDKVDQLFSFALPNQRGKMVLKKGAEVLAEWEFGSAKEGQSIQIDWKTVESESSESSESRGRVERKFCYGTDEYGGGENKGTPGLRNRECL